MIGGFFVLQKQNEAKTFVRICTLCIFILFGLPRFGIAESRNDDPAHFVIARLLQKVEAI